MVFEFDFRDEKLISEYSLKDLYDVLFSGTAVVMSDFDGTIYRGEPFILRYSQSSPFDLEKRLVFQNPLKAAKFTLKNLGSIVNIMYHQDSPELFAIVESFANDLLKGYKIDYLKSISTDLIRNIYGSSVKVIKKMAPSEVNIISRGYSFLHKPLEEMLNCEVKDYSNNLKSEHGTVFGIDNSKLVKDTKDKMIAVEDIVSRNNDSILVCFGNTPGDLEAYEPARKTGHTITIGIGKYLKDYDVVAESWHSILHIVYENILTRKKHF